MIEIRAGNSPVKEKLDDLRINGEVSWRTEQELDIELSIINMTIKMVVVSSCSHPSMEAFRTPPLSVSQVRLNPEKLLASAVTNHHDAETITPGKHWPVVSSFASTLQLGQALLYELDGVDRDFSNTLCMKQCTFHFSAGTPDTKLIQPVHVRLEDA